MNFRARVLIAASDAMAMATIAAVSVLAFMAFHGA
jgi:hypothetical protein